jgi:hypothetical protein
VWVEVPSSDGFNLLIGDNYFAPGSTADTLKRYFGYLGHVQTTHNFGVFRLGDFNVPLFECKLGLSPAISQYYNKLKGEAISSSICLLGLSQCNYSSNNGHLLDLVYLEMKISCMVF